MEKNNTEKINQKLEHQQCSHPTLVMEVAYGGATGNFICMQCECLITPKGKHQTQVQPNIHQMRKNTEYLQTPGLLYQQSLTASLRLSLV